MNFEPRSSPLRGTPGGRRRRCWGRRSAGRAGSLLLACSLDFGGLVLGRIGASDNEKWRISLHFDMQVLGSLRKTMKFQKGMSVLSSL